MSFLPTLKLISTGVAHNKTLAKLACDMHKPRQQTTLPRAAVSGLFSTLPVSIPAACAVFSISQAVVCAGGQVQRVRGLGRKMGEELVAKGVAVMGELLR